MVLVPLSRGLLYSMGPFFAHPLKPAANMLFGDTYAMAYKHFRRDHTKPANLRMHVVALGLQLFSNFSLLQLLDTALQQYLGPTFIPKVFGVSVSLVASTAIAWAATLLACPSPAWCRLLSVVSIATAASVTSFTIHTVTPLQFEAGALSLFNAVMLWSVGVNGATLYSMLFTAFFVVLGQGLNLTPYAGFMAEYGAHAAVGCTGALFAMAILLADPVTAVVAVGHLSLHWAGTLCSQPALQYLGFAYTAMMLQDQAHKVSKQAATFRNIQHTGESSGVKTQFEWCHVVYFPTLLFHSIAESGGLGTTKKQQ